MCVFDIFTIGIIVWLCAVVVVVVVRSVFATEVRVCEMVRWMVMWMVE